MTGPSASGSENGTPTSSTSAPARSSALQDLRGARQIGIAGGDVGDQPRRAVPRAAARTSSARRLISDCRVDRPDAQLSLTVCTSLSPRPDRLTSDDRPRLRARREPHARRRSRAPIRAPEGCPSSRASVWNAVERLGIRRRARTRRARARAARRARVRPRRNRGRPRSNASARCCPSSSCRTNVRVPCSTPVLPPAKRAAWRPRRDPLAAGLDANQPHARVVDERRRRCPMALLPPPTQATTTSGRRPACSRICARASRADHRLELAHHQRIRMRAERRAEQVVRVGDIGHPVAHRLVDRVLQRAAAGVDAVHRRRRAAASGTTLSACRRMSSAPM